MSDRGDYRSFYCSFWDDADLHTLSDGAYRVLTTLKGTLAAAGIGVVYLSTLGDRCGKTRDEIEAALCELETVKPGARFGWIVRERNIVWVVNGLRYEPGLKSSNKNHRVFVRDRLLAPLGEGAPIVLAFRRHYAEWFDDGIQITGDTPPDGSRMGIEAPSKQSPIQHQPVLPTPALPTPSQPKPAPAPAAAARTLEESLEPLNLAVWANRGITARWGEQPNALTVAGATSLAAELQALKVEPTVARLSIERQARESRSERPPKSVGYFGPGIKEDWEREQVRRRSAEGGVSAPAMDPINAALDEFARRETAKELAHA